MKVKMICHCGKHYLARDADLARGWARSCSKHCAAVRRDFGRKAAKRADGIPLKMKQSFNGSKRIKPETRTYERVHDDEREPEFCDAHLFSNEDHDCNKD